MPSHRTPDHILQVGLGFWRSKTLLSAVEMELFTELRRGPEDLESVQGGFDYTGADCTGWMEEAGFKQTRVEHLVAPDSMVIGIK